jgi:D-alanyl-D-alanine carboxypeptidase (penicillin-binding protein 5/6)
MTGSSTKRSRWTMIVVLGLVAVMMSGAVVVLIRDSGAASPATPIAATVAPTVTATVAATPTPVPTEPQKPTKAKLAKKKYVLPGSAPDLPWPSSGQAKVEVAGLGVLGRSGSTRAVPIASITKVMTAYTVLRNHPLSGGRSGPMITVSAAEAAALPQQQANGESVVVVEAGEKLSERDAMKGLLVASGANMAQILARWDAGSEAAFVRKMNANARRLGMTSTHYADSSGLDAGSVSTAADLLKLAPVVMSDPTFAALVGTRSTHIPLNPHLTNPNALLGVHGVIGIKSGTTTAAGGCLLFAAQHKELGNQTIYGVVLGISGDRSAIHSNARDAADDLVVVAGDALKTFSVLRAGDTLATLIDRKGEPVKLTVAENVRVAGWSGQSFRFTLPSLKKGEIPKTLTVHTPAGTKKVKLVRR